NQKYRIDKDQFIIGRGSKSSDLPIKDGNISRKHAAVIRRNGTYFIKDLGSTNGIDFKGMRIDNKRIDEGDLFHLCDYELRFTYTRWAAAARPGDVARAPVAGPPRRGTGAGAAARRARPAHGRRSAAAPPARLRRPAPRDAARRGGGPARRRDGARARRR